jgi:putative iron-regulated protein
VRVVLLASLFAVGACAPAVTPAAVVRQYAVDLDANYKDVIVELEKLNTAVDAFVAAPSEAGLTAARNAWLAARPSYGECEVSRFYGGPIDQAQGSMNEWPIDETFIDYTAGSPTGGIINDLTDYPMLTPEVLATSDERGGIENLSTGFHAIELLLWGQRPDPTGGPGTRPYTDYVDGGTAQNQSRRRQYLQVATQLLLDDMRALESQWDLSNASSYAGKLVAATPQDSLTKIYRGFSQMAISELFYERMYDPFVSKDRKDEESCFSESTLTDLNANALGVEDVYLGRYQKMQGIGIADLVKAKDPALDASVKKQLAAARAAIAAIPPPFDHAVQAPDGTAPRKAVQKAVDSFSSLRTTLDSVAQTLGILNNL